MTYSRKARVIRIKHAEFQASMAAICTWSGLMMIAATLSATMTVKDTVAIRVRPETSVWWIQNPNHVLGLYRYSEDTPVQT